MGQARREIPVWRLGLEVEQESEVAETSSASLGFGVVGVVAVAVAAEGLVVWEDRGVQVALAVAVRGRVPAGIPEERAVARGSSAGFAAAVVAGDAGTAAARWS